MSADKTGVFAGDAALTEQQPGLSRTDTPNTHLHR